MRIERSTTARSANWSASECERAGFGRLLTDNDVGAIRGRQGDGARSSGSPLVWWVTWELSEMFESGDGGMKKVDVLNIERGGRGLYKEVVADGGR
jgi:hypothetical protein